MAFSTAYPADAIPTLVGYLRGTGVTVWQALAAGYDLLGFALGTAAASGTALPMVALEVNDPALALEGVHEALALGQMPTWLVPLLMQILQTLLTRAAAPSA